MKVGFALLLMSVVACSSHEQAPLAGSGAGGKKSSGGSAGAAEQVCVPGATVSCLGPGACDGAQACLPSGLGYGECDCGALATGGSSDGGATGVVVGHGGTGSGGALSGVGGELVAGADAGGSGSGGAAGSIAGGTSGSGTGGGAACVKNVCESQNAYRCGDSSDNCGGTLHCPTTCPEGGECGASGVSWLCSCWHAEGQFACHDGGRNFACIGGNSEPKPKPTIAGCVANPEDPFGNNWCCP